MLFGAHVSAAGGVFNAPLNAAEIGCEVFQFFTRSPQGGPVPPLTPEIVALFKKNCKSAGQKEWYVHAPFFINFASVNPRVYHASISVIRQELERSNLLGAKYLMAHLGSYNGLGKEKGFKQLIEGLDKMLHDYGRDVARYVSTTNDEPTQFLVEISAGAGEIIGDEFGEIAEIVNHPKLKKYNIGVCFDTQHAFGSGYDLRTPIAVAETLRQFDQTIGLAKLKLSHCNDSKPALGSHKDRHEHIGQGQIGLAGFEAILNNKDFKKINFICETEHDLIKEDIKTLKNIRDNK